MIYNNFQDIKLSALGMGNMRLPVIDGDDSKIDLPKVEEMYEYAFEKGINYFDTAWGYHNGNSEIAVGKVLKNYDRNSFYVATKFPGYDPDCWNKVEEIFNKQLEKVQVDYFDFYLFHNVCEMNIDAYLDDEKYGIYSYLIKMKNEGKIKHLGFSTHGTYDTMKRFLDAYAKDMEFCQIQLNYFDYNFQNAKEKIELIESYGLPVWVMEPVRGGKLAVLDEKYETKLKELRPDEKSVAWAFRFLQSLPSVTLTLSGMSNFEQLKENIATYEQAKPLDENEMQTLLGIANDMSKSIALPCTKCRYCTSHCPQGLNIPELVEMYNEHMSTKDGFGFIVPMKLSAMSDNEKPSSCIGCKSCETVCPQKIEISKMMKDLCEMVGL